VAESRTFAKLASERREQPLPVELWSFLRATRKWWLLPVVVLLLLLAAFIILSTTAAGPFIYTLF